VGSSKAMMRAFLMSALAISTICRWAMDRRRVLVEGETSSPRRRSWSPARASIARRFRIPARFGNIPRSTFSATVISGTRFSSW